MILFNNPVTGPDGEQYNADAGMLELLSGYYLSGDITYRDAFIEGVRCGRIWPVAGSTELSRAVAPQRSEDEYDCN